MAQEKLKPRAEIAPGHRWDLSPLFTSDDEWEEAYRGVSSRVSEYEKYRGRLHESAALFKEAIEFDLTIGREIDTIATYAHLRNDEDKTNMKYEELYQRMIVLHTSIAERASFLVPEMQALPRERADEYLADEALAGYRFYLEKIFRYREHTRSTEVEEILAMSGEVHHASSTIFSQLDNADLTFGSLADGKGITVELTHGSFSSFLQERDREIRKNAFFQYYASYNAHKHTIAAALSTSVKKDRLHARIRHFESARAKSLFSDNVPLSVFDNLIGTVRSRISPLAKYLDLRRRILGLDELHIYDTYVPLVNEIDFSMPYEEAVTTCVEALSPLGNDYCGILKEGLEGGWVDRYENKGKRSGAYSSGCYDSPPYILMNYRDDNINSLYTLIHEAGHSMHSYYSHATQPYVYGDYTIFVAEVASTFNETLLSNYLLEKYRDNNSMRAYILNREIDNIRATLYRQTMFAEFEKITHDIVERGDPLTLEVLRGKYRELLEVYFGGKLVIDEPLELECLRIPHFYSAFYVYKYATGISAAIALAEKVLKSGVKAREEYRRFLTLGGSAFPIQELAVAGVDMSSSEPIEYALDHFSNLVDKFSREIG
jgi:oligoendopeptidase F